LPLRFPAFLEGTMGRQFKMTVKLKRKARYNQRVKDRIKEKIKGTQKKK
jgi:hypothetical protein